MMISNKQQVNADWFNRHNKILEKHKFELLKSEGLQPFIAWNHILADALSTAHMLRTNDSWDRARTVIINVTNSSTFTCDEGKEIQWVREFIETQLEIEQKNIELITNEREFKNQIGVLRYRLHNATRDINEPSPLHSSHFLDELINSGTSGSTRYHSNKILYALIYSNEIKELFLEMIEKSMEKCKANYAIESNDAEMTGSTLVSAAWTRVHPNFIVEFSKKVCLLLGEKYLKEGIYKFLIERNEELKIDNPSLYVNMENVFIPEECINETSMQTAVQNAHSPLSCGNKMFDQLEKLGNIVWQLSNSIYHSAIIYLSKQEDWVEMIKNFKTSEGNDLVAVPTENSIFEQCRITSSDESGAITNLMDTIDARFYPKIVTSVDEGCISRYMFIIINRIISQTPQETKWENYTDIKKEKFDKLIVPYLNKIVEIHRDSLSPRNSIYFPLTNTKMLEIDSQETSLELQSFIKALTEENEIPLEFKEGDKVILNERNRLSVNYEKIKAGTEVTIKSVLSKPISKHIELKGLEWKRPLVEENGDIYGRHREDYGLELIIKTLLGTNHNYLSNPDGVFEKMGILNPPWAGTTLTGVTSEQVWDFFRSCKDLRVHNWQWCDYNTVGNKILGIPYSCTNVYVPQGIDGNVTISRLWKPRMNSYINLNFLGNRRDLYIPPIYEVFLKADDGTDVWKSKTGRVFQVNESSIQSKEDYVSIPEDKVCAYSFEIIDKSDALQSCLSNKWIHCDDEKVRYVGEEVFIKGEEENGDEVAWDYYLDEYNWRDDCIWGWVSGGDEGYFSEGADYCYSEYHDVYFMNASIAVDNYYQWSERSQDWIHEEDEGEYDENDERNDSAIKSYGYKPSPLFKYVKGENKGDTRKTIRIPSNDPIHQQESIQQYEHTSVSLSNTNCYGVELEINCPESDSQIVAEKVSELDGGDTLYCKWDSSVEEGFEIVSHPLSLKKHKQSRIWRDVMKIARKSNATSYKSKQCGIHVHANANSMTNEGWWKVIMFFDHNRRVIRKFSQRTSARLNQWAKIAPVCDYMPTSVQRSFPNAYKALIAQCKNNVKPYYKNGRYSAVNVQRDTVEFRLFRGTTNIDRFLNSIAFVDSVIQFCGDRSLPFFLNEKKAYYGDKPGLSEKNSWEEYAKMIKGNNQYKELEKYLIKKKLIR